LCRRLQKNSSQAFRGPFGGIFRVLLMWFFFFTQISKQDQLKDIVQSHTKLRIDVRDGVLEVVGYMGQVNEAEPDGDKRGSGDTQQDNDDEDSPR
jgi:hypothetical protein